LQSACRKLTALANEHGGEDNITAVLVRIVENDEDSALDGAPDSERAPIPTEPGIGA
jgi:serine/threonine protein phosphatase PrpC